MQKSESSGGVGSKPGKKPPDIAPSASKSSLPGDERIDAMIDPQSTDLMDYPMALFDPVSVNTHEKERKERQTVNTLNDIYKQASRFDDIFIEPPYEINMKPQHKLTPERDMSYENVKIMLSLYDWFAAAVFDVEACQPPMTDEELSSSSNAMSEANTFTKGRFRKLQAIKNEIQEKCYVLRTFLKRKNEVAEELLKELGIREAINRPPAPKVGAKGRTAAATTADGDGGAVAAVAAPAVAVSWRQAAKSVAESLKRAKADGFFEFLEAEDKFKIVVATAEKQEAKIKELVANQRALQTSLHSLSAHNMSGEGASAGPERKSFSHKATELKSMSDYTDRLVKLLKQAAEQIKLLNGVVESADDGFLKLIEAELNNAPKAMESSPSVKSLREDSSRHSSINEKGSTEKTKADEANAVAKNGGDSRAASTTTAAINKVAPIPEEPKKGRKSTSKAKGKKKEVPRRSRPV